MNIVANNLFSTVMYDKLPKLYYHPYKMILDRMKCNGYISQNLQHVKVVIKGTTAYRLLCPKEMETMPMSDLDIVICINPHLQRDIFDRIFNNMNIIVAQVLSLHKKTMDHMFFFERSNPCIKHILYDNDKISDAIQSNVSQMNVYGLQSVFSSIKVRNILSKTSFIVLDGAIQDVQFFPFCNRIPLHRTPIYCTQNTVCFNIGERLGMFNLHRLKINACCTTRDVISSKLRVQNDEMVILKLQTRQYFDKITLDFIDISILHQCDTELLDMWNNYTFVLCRNTCIDTPIMVPDLKSCIVDLEKMLYVFNCPETKRESRYAKLQLLRNCLKLASL